MYSFSASLGSWKERKNLGLGDKCDDNSEVQWDKIRLFASVWVYF